MIPTKAKNISMRSYVTCSYVSLDLILMVSEALKLQALSPKTQSLGKTEIKLRGFGTLAFSLWRQGAQGDRWMSGSMNFSPIDIITMATENKAQMVHSFIIHFTDKLKDYKTMRLKGSY